jgi:hypothetical protein
MRVVPGKSVGMPNPHRFRRPGRFYAGNITAGGNFPGSAIVAGKYYSYPFYVEENFRIDQIGFGVTSALANAVGRIAIYSDVLNAPGENQLYFPGKLLYVQPEQDCSTTGAKATTLSPPLCLSRGRLYWLAACMSHAISVNTMSYDLIGGVLGYWTDAGDLNYYSQATSFNKTGLQYADFPPDPFPADGSPQALTSVPAVYMRAA